MTTKFEVNVFNFSIAMANNKLSFSDLTSSDNLEDKILKEMILLTYELMLNYMVRLLHLKKEMGFWHQLFSLCKSKCC